jgi:hypothetical protein
MAANKKILYEYDQVVFKRNCKTGSNKKARSTKRPGFFIGVAPTGKCNKQKLQMRRKREVSDEIINECVYDQVHNCFIRK